MTTNQQTPEDIKYILQQYRHGGMGLTETELELLEIAEWQQATIEKQGDALEEIADKECNHLYPSRIMVDVCEACRARVALEPPPFPLPDEQ